MDLKHVTDAALEYNEKASRLTKTVTSLCKLLPTDNYIVHADTRAMWRRLPLYQVVGVLSVGTALVTSLVFLNFSVGLALLFIGLIVTGLSGM